VDNIDVVPENSASQRGLMATEWQLRTRDVKDVDLDDSPVARCADRATELDVVEPLRGSTRDAGTAAAPVG
jgi:hypothetical protein